ncbi:type ISP restriction/modification enzyme, partial [Micromonospora sp. ATA51]|uniref:type ISP restriction/modification enzyme n=1 Tax=Micromonospora sp. ATA51 TaxID=2806098 RepID=UPI001A57EBE4
LLIPDRRERTYPRAVKRARHNQYRVKKPDEPGASATTDPPRSGSTSSATKLHDQLRLRGIALGPVPAAVWDYDVCGTQVVKKWFDYRSKKPRVRKSSPLNEIVATKWDFTDDLRNLLAVLHGCVLLEPQQDDVLTAILDGPLLRATELENSGMLPPAAEAKQPIIEAQPPLF